MHYFSVGILLDVAIALVLTAPVGIERDKMDKPSGWFVRGVLTD